MALPAHPADTPLLLVVDDDALVRDMVAVSLTRAGYRVAVAADGDAAVAWIETATPALILTDLFMPNTDGIELLRSGRLGAVRPPVIAMSGGYAGIDMLSASKALGATATIAKPFLPRDLVALVRRTLADAASARDGWAETGLIWAGSAKDQPIGEGASAASVGKPGRRSGALAHPSR